MTRPPGSAQGGGMTPSRALALALPAALLTMLTPTPPASQAGGVDPCNRSYERIASAPVLSPSTGEVLARVRLLHKPGTKQLCGRVHVRRGLDVRRNRVQIRLQVSSATESSGYVRNRSRADDVDPLVVDAHGYPAGSSVSVVAGFRGAELATTELVTALPQG